VSRSAFLSRVRGGMTPDEAANKPRMSNAEAGRKSAQLLECRIGVTHMPPMVPR
jgi:hypothetical protein